MDTYKYKLLNDLDYCYHNDCNNCSFKGTANCVKHLTDEMLVIINGLKEKLKKIDGKRLEHQLEQYNKLVANLNNKLQEELNNEETSE